MIKRLQRTKEQYGPASGKHILDSKYFSVIHWYHGDNKKSTALTINGSGFGFREEIRFEGHQDLDSDEKCISQLKPLEILKLIKDQHDLGFKKGGNSKIEEFQKVFEKEFV